MRRGCLFEKDAHIFYNSKIVGIKAKGRTSKPVFQENKARQIFRKTNISYHIIRTPTKSKSYSEPTQTCKIKLFLEIANGSIFSDV